MIAILYKKWIMRKLQKALPDSNSLKKLYSAGEYNHPEFDRGYWQGIDEAKRAIIKAIKEL